MLSHVPVCCHQELSNFTGRTEVLTGNGVLVYMLGKFDRLNASAPLQFDIELPQQHEVPWWFRAYIWACPSLEASWEKPRVTLELEACQTSCYLAGMNCSDWTVTLPWVPIAIDMHEICGYLPVRFVMRQGRTKYGRFTIQQRKYCTQLKH